MPQFVFSNFINTTLSAAVTSTDTSLSVTSATNFPTLETGQQIPVTLINAATQTVYEIIYVTAISGTTITVLRGQEGTVAQAWSIGDLVKGCITAATVSPSPGTHSPVSSETLPVTLGTLKVTPGTLTEDITLTTPNAGDPGSETTIYGSASAYTTTVSTGVTSGSPYIELPDGSQVYSYVIPASSPGAGIRIVWDGTNYRATMFGQVAPQRINYQGGVTASTTYGQTVTFTAPSNGWVCMECTYNNNTLNALGDITENLIINGTTVTTDTAQSAASWHMAGYLYVTAGTAVSATAEYVVGTTALTNAVNLRGLVWFVPST